MSSVKLRKIMMVCLDRQVLFELTKPSVVVAAASARHAECARACILGLGERQKATGRPTHYVHVSCILIVL